MAVINHCFKLCTFDVTNTLLKFQSSVGEQYAEIGKIYGVERDPNQISKSFRHHWKIMNTNHPNYGKNTGLSSHEWWKEIVRQTFIVESNELTTNQLNSISGHLYNLYKSNICWKVEDGAETLLKHLKKKDIKLGVISNFDERLDCVLKSNGLKPYFDFILASYLVRAAKPSREIFDLALNQSASINASQALHIGDNVKLDYFAAKHAGWNALLLTKSNIDNQCLDQVDPSEIVNNMEEIEKFVLSSS
ncbi:haloacid dehalogenase-like hydrolase domain-containing protein 3 [Caerostris darwini]|uniref:Haloacid dehalogenase-like hydrolase domain-containing protein 3 n=1 Tax=Caerostris darwini TaxID=1538125 RepID=A0AAV4SR16_9ARAC|nr:haloacid dehalogenase-like hydrolase domain-containing protein 3 [Caerostris darwini]